MDHWSFCPRSSPVSGRSARRTSTGPGRHGMSVRLVRHRVTLMVLVGSPSRRDMTAAAADASARLGLEVNLTRVDPVTWEGNDDGFVTTVKARPHVALAINATAPAGQA